MEAPVMTPKQYVEQREGGYWIAGTRISLDSVVYEFLKGTSPEGIVQSFPLLTLEQVYGGITFYLANREAINTYLKEGEAIFDKMRQEARKTNSRLYQKLMDAQVTRP